MLCFRTVPVAKIVMEKMGEHQKFPSIVFLSHSAKKFQGEPFSAVSQKNSHSEKVYVKEGGVVKTFSVEKLCLTVPKKVVGEPFSFSLIPRIERLYASQ